MAGAKLPGQRTFRGVAPEQRREERRERLLRAALHLFGTRGYHQTTVRDVCAAAQLTERYFYESFENMSRLYAALQSGINVQLRSEILSAVMSAPREPMPMAEAAVRVYLEFLKADRERARVLLVESVVAGKGSDVMSQAAGAWRHFVTLLRGFVVFLFPRASSQGFNVDMMCNGVIGATNYMAHDWIKSDLATPLDEVLRTIMSFYRGLAAQLEEADRSSKAAAAEPKP